MAYKYDFFHDLGKAKKEEILAAEQVLNTMPALYPIRKTLNFNDDNRYDFSFKTLKGKRIRFEVKDDDYTFKSKI